MDLANLRDDILLQNKISLQNGLETAFSGKNIFPAQALLAAQRLTSPWPRAGAGQRGTVPSQGLLSPIFVTPWGWGQGTGLQEPGRVVLAMLLSLSPGFHRLPHHPALPVALGTGAGKW